ncbi:MAG TPA: phage baseplate assembly protein V [Polyangiaceae bacterium]|jgi:uncharacterized protein involved in type VI secretion and phage assembly
MEKSLLETIVDDRALHGLGGRFFGVFPAQVTSLKDPDGQGRVRVQLPWSADPSGAQYETWARLATMMAGNNRGSFFIPDVNDEVLVAFEAGDPRRPYVLGALWNGSDSPPASMDSGGQNNTKVLRSRNGVKITLDDTSGSETFVVETPGGQKITLQDGAGTITVEDSNGNEIQTGPSGVTITTSGNFTVQASQIELTASSATVSAASTTFSGMVNGSVTVLTPAVVSSSYTPGAGNIL